MRIPPGWELGTPDSHLGLTLRSFLQGASEHEGLRFLSPGYWPLLPALSSAWGSGAGSWGTTFPRLPCQQASSAALPTAGTRERLVSRKWGDGTPCVFSSRWHYSSRTGQLQLQPLLLGGYFQPNRPTPLRGTSTGAPPWLHPLVVCCPLKGPSPSPIDRPLPQALWPWKCTSSLFSPRGQLFPGVPQPALLFMQTWIPM